MKKKLEKKQMEKVSGGWPIFEGSVAKDDDVIVRTKYDGIPLDSDSKLGK